MKNQFFAAIHFDGIILETTVGCIFETCQKIRMRFNRNVPIGDMKEKVSEKFSQRCGRKMTKLFYKFQVSSNPIKFTEMELLDDDSVETMVALYCPLGRVNTKPIKLFVELADVDIVENVTQLSQQDGVENSRTKVPRVSVDRRSFVRGFDIDLNVGCSYQYGGGLQIHPVVIETDVLVEDGSDNNSYSDHEGKDFSDPDLDNIPDDIDNEGSDDRNDHSPSVRNSSYGITIRYDPRAHISSQSRCDACLRVFQVLEHNTCSLDVSRS
ncbi:hypothetical protein J1N35_038283 [Gossypium stocksii]|uniref:Uncharacterized protein n=1 Tax=Gossypium stocksii TaxID=47602 RepID=A0A9D3UME8_9ROSI|nr:hypothetical protein J1N35_038283 [Gossypium stocksii]